MVDGWLLYFYLPPEGKGQVLVPLAFYGIVVLMARVVSVIITPPIGYWSDHLHSRWGRRLPLMFSASLPLLIMFVLLWLPPIHGESIVNLYYLGIILILFNIAEALVIIPLGALLPELAIIDRHRVRLTMWSAIFQLIGVILAGLAGLLIDGFGFVQMALIYAALILPLFYLPFLTLREQPGRQIDASQRFGFLQSLSITLRNRAFLILSATGICFWTATTFLMAGHALYRHRNLSLKRGRCTLFLHCWSAGPAGVLSTGELAGWSFWQMERVRRFAAGFGDCLTGSDVDRPLVSHSIDGAGIDLDCLAVDGYVGGNDAAAGLCRRDHRLRRKTDRPATGRSLLLSLESARTVNQRHRRSHIALALPAGAQPIRCKWSARACG